MVLTQFPWRDARISYKHCSAKKSRIFYRNEAMLLPEMQQKNRRSK